MGKIINFKQLKKKNYLINLILKKQELKDLKGHMKKVHFFAENKCIIKACLKEKGNNKTTKYFQIPMTLRPRKNLYSKLTYQRIEAPKANYYIYGLMN